MIRALAAVAMVLASAGEAAAACGPDVIALGIWGRETDRAREVVEAAGYADDDAYVGCIRLGSASEAPAVEADSAVISGVWRYEDDKGQLPEAWRARLWSARPGWSRNRLHADRDGGLWLRGCRIPEPDETPVYSLVCRGDCKPGGEVKIGTREAEIREYEQAAAACKGRRKCAVLGLPPASPCYCAPEAVTGGEG